MKQAYLITGLLTVILAFAVIYFLQRSNSRKTKSFLEIQKILNQKLQENDHMKSRFFANISHEFRTPLSLIIAPMEEKLSAPSLSSEDSVIFQLVKRNAQRLLSLVNQLLDLSKLDAGKMELHLRKDNLEKFLAVVVGSFDSLAESKKIHFNKHINLNPAEHWFDADKLEKIINNILSNAFKFTSKDGAVTLSIFSLPLSNELQLEVKDTGRGILLEEQQHGFSPFYQSRHAVDDGTGTGLGLSLLQSVPRRIILLN